jgi:protein PhnA
MEKILNCPSCNSPYGYETDNGFSCPECGFEWEDEEVCFEVGFIVKDANGAVLQDGDTVVIVKDLPVKGAPKSIKAGTKVKNIKLVEGDHNINCKIDGFGLMALKSEFVKKA